MTTYVLIVAMVTGGGYPSYPYQTNTYIERGFVSREACAEAAKPYVALGNLRDSGRSRIFIPQVTWDCVEVKQ